MARKDKINWSLYDHLLGTDTDEKLALLIGCTDGNIRHRRKKLGVPPAVYSSWTENDETLLRQGLLQCVDCKQPKQLLEFYTNPRTRTGTRRMCRSCTESHRKRKRLDLKQKCLQTLGGVCRRCEFNETIAALQFHHVNGEDKDFMISRAGLQIDDEELNKELDKCCVLCSNCHDGFHSGELKIVFEKLPFGWTVASSEVLTSPPNNCPNEDRVNHF